MQMGAVVFRGTARFRLVRFLGQGGMGVVYEAHDEVNGAPVALKLLPLVSPDLLLQFKREFRAIADIRHPNLVRLGELISEDSQWFFTMELVHGVDLVSYALGMDPPHRPSQPVRPPSSDRTSFATVSAMPAAKSNPIVAGAYDPARLRSVFAQLAQALSALHEAGCVHRDVKPSNVLVTEDGRAVLLDFSLTSSAGAETILTSAGTPEYMAPEQIAQTQVTGAADWYAFGVILFELLTGRLPFLGLKHEILYHKQHSSAPRVTQLVPSAPPDLAALCDGLLERDAERRPSARQVLALLAPTAAVLPAPRLTGIEASPFVGRDQERQVLTAALDAVRAGQGARALVIRGESGVGKSTLVRSFLDSSQRGSDTIMLTARCYERELVPFKAVDGLVDALVQVLRKFDPAVLEPRLPRRAGLLMQAFPVLGRIPSLALAPQDYAAMDPQEVRATMFAAFRELLVAVSETAPILAFIDDFQWADADSLALLTEVLRPPAAPRLLLLATVRTSTSGTEAAASLFGNDITEEQLTLRNLSQDETRTLARDLLRGRGGRDAEGGAELLVRESGGHPLFLLELARTMHLRQSEGGRLTLDGVLRTKIESFSEPAVRILRILGISGAPTPARLVRSIVGLDTATVIGLLDELRIARLIHSTSESGTELIDIAHDRIRQVASTIAPSTHVDVQEIHRQLAEGFESDGNLLRAAAHWREAGHSNRAAVHFAAAARRAAEAMAFDQAVEHYGAALSMGDWDAEKKRGLVIGLGDALANAGRGVEAAKHYLAAAEGAAPPAALHLHTRGAEELIRNGRLDEGCAVAAEALAEVGLGFSRTPLRALLWQRALLRLRGRRFRRRSAEEIAPRALARVDLCWSLSSGLGLMDPVQGAHFQVRSLLLALQAGEPYRVARGVAGESAYSAAQGQERRATQMLEEATRIADSVKNPHGQGIVFLMSGLACHLLGKFRDGATHLEAATRVFRDRCVGTSWELNAARHFTLECLYYTGELPRFRASAVEGRREARERGSVYASTTFRTGLANATWLMEDDPVRARRDADEAMAAWSARGYHIQHWYALMAQAQIDLYRADGEAAHARVEAGWPQLRRSKLLKIRHTRIVALHLRGRAALAAAVARNDRSGAGARARDEALALAERCAARLVRESAGWGRPLASLIHAAVQHTRGDAQSSRQWLQRAAAECAAHELVPFKVAAEMAARELSGKTATEAVGQLWLQERGVRSPMAFARMLAPGLPIGGNRQ